MKEIITTGTKLSFKVSDAFNHENEIRNFMVVESGICGGEQHLMYNNNECSCKDGWIKFENIAKAGHLNLNILIAHLEKYYGDKFDKTTIKFIE